MTDGIEERNTLATASTVTGYEITVELAYSDQHWRFTSRTLVDFSIGQSGNLTVRWNSNDGGQHAQSFAVGEWRKVSRRILRKGLDS